MALQWPDINFDQCLIHIRRSVYRKKGESLKFKKTKRLTSIRTIDVSQEVILMLKEHKEKQLNTMQFIEGYNPQILYSLSKTEIYLIQMLSPNATRKQLKSWILNRIHLTICAIHMLIFY